MLTLSNYSFNPGNGNLTLGNCMDIITMGNLTLDKYTLVTFILGNLALRLNNDTPEYVQSKTLPHFKILYTDGICSVSDIFHPINTLCWTSHILSSS